MQLYYEGKHGNHNENYVTLFCISKSNFIFSSVTILGDLPSLEPETVARISCTDNDLKNDTWTECAS